MKEAKREIGSLLASVLVRGDSEEQEHDPNEHFTPFESWHFTRISHTRAFSALSFEGQGRTEWQTFDRDLVVAPSLGSILIEFNGGMEEAATPDHPSLIEADTRTRLTPKGEHVSGVLLFVPPILTDDDE